MTPAPQTSPSDHEAQHRRYLATRMFGSLDGLRCLAIVAVVWHHYGPQLLGIPISSRGFLGVDLFFVISGFLICTLLLREREKTGSIWLLGFHARRSLRVFPAYYTMLAVVIGWALLKSGSNADQILHDGPFAALFVSNIFPARGMLALTWSLSVEEQFYLALPLIEKYARRQAALILPVLYLLFSLPALGALASWPLPPFFRQATFGPILLGAMLAHVLNNPRLFGLAARWITPWTSAIALALLVFVANGGLVAEAAGWPRVLVHWLMTLLVAACVVREGHALRWLLRLWPVRRIGAMSYGIYLYHHLAAHFVVAGLGSAALPGRMPRLYGALLASWLIAELSHRLVEARFLAAKQGFGALAAAAPGTQRDLAHATRP